MALEIKSEKKIGEVAKSTNSKVVVSIVEANIGKYVAIENWFVGRGKTTFEQGKSMWIPIDQANDVAKLIQEGLGVDTLLTLDLTNVKEA
jgi:hypothetical protein